MRACRLSLAVPRPLKTATCHSEVETRRANGWLENPENPVGTLREQAAQPFNYTVKLPGCENRHQSPQPQCSPGTTRSPWVLHRKARKTVDWRDLQIVLYASCVPDLVPKKLAPQKHHWAEKEKIPNRSRLFIAKEKTCKQQLLYSFHQGPGHAKSRQRRSSTPRGPDEASQQPCPCSDKEGVSQAQWCPRLIVPNTERKSNTNHIHCSRKQRRREHFRTRLLQSTARWSNQRSLPEHRCKTR